MIDTSPPSRHGELATALATAITPLARRLRQQATDGLSPSQQSVIGTINRHGPLTLGALAKRERVSPPMVTRLVASLEERGFVTKATPEDDRRTCHVELSAAGHAWLLETRGRRDAWLAARLDRLSAEERMRLAAVLPMLERLTAEPD